MNLPPRFLGIKTLSVRRLVCLIGVLHCLSVIGRSDVEKIRRNPQAEEFVRARLAKGLDADLAERFPNRADRGLGAKFLYETLTNANINEWRFGVEILNAVFPGFVDLRNADVLVEVRLKRCSFTQYVDFQKSHFRKGLRLSESEFNEGLSMSDATIDGDLRMNGVKVPMDQPSYFFGLRVSGELDISKSSFGGGAYFSYLEVGKDLSAAETNFVNPKADVYFDNIRIKGRATFLHAKFLCYVSFQFATFETVLNMRQARFESTAPDDFYDFRSMKIGGHLDLRKTVFAGEVDFERTEVTYKFNLSGAQFDSTSKRTSFINMKTDVFDLSQAKFATPYEIAGMQYREAVAENDPTSIVANAVFSSDAYANLEASLKRQGKEAIANRVYIAQKRRERAGLSFPGKVASVFLDVLVGYGRRPWLAFAWSTLFVLIGCVVFWRREGMSPLKPEHADRSYSPFLYSLDLFLPFVNLRADEFWEPRKDRRMARWYVAIHTLLGWILIPIGLAAVSGLVK